MFKLVIQDDEGKTTVVPLIRDEITIGRKEGNTIRLTERNVSRRHARILRNNGEVQIEDLGSYNGIRVNNARIAERVSLRVSDQVQIGDYKLYLKAEGVEQVDDAQTRPIERVDNAPTDVMNAVVPPTQPMSVASATPVPGTLIGNPNRTLVAISDTDPQGRPVATAAAVAALTAPTGYGKLVVLSSNFAGKEFELSRPQMIIGRTDENDIVINHRSISRNHAKLVREPDTARYTISDLQSSNGVRVNGQDYGKVELRRGDVIDLGHVRLRFVEPGEDFVFARDAVITDVPDAGGRRGLLVAVILSVLVIGGIVAFVVLRGGGGDKKPDLGGTGPGTGGGTGSAVAGTDPPDAAGQVAVETPDAAETAPPPAPPDASQVGSSEIEVECLRYQADRKWDDLDSCATRLMTTNAAAAKDFKSRAALETKAQGPISRFETAIRDRDLKKAAEELKQIPNTALDYRKLKERYDQAEGVAIAAVVQRLKGAISGGDCKEKEYDQILAQERASKPARVAEEARRQVRCVQRPDPQPTRCDADAFVEKGKEQYATGQLGPALASYEAAWNCKQDPQHAEKAFVIACNLASTGKARLHWKRMTTVMRQRAAAICVRNGITQDMLDAP